MTDVETKLRDGIDLDFVVRVLSIYNGFEGLSNDDVWWRTGDEYAPITLFATCNDFFVWGCADCEEITPKNVGALEKAVADVAALTEHKDTQYADLLFCARERGMRPQGAYYKHLPAVLHPLFNACGPERVVGLGNPLPPIQTVPPPEAA